LLDLIGHDRRDLPGKQKRKADLAAEAHEQSGRCAGRLLDEPMEQFVANHWHVTGKE